MSVIQAKDLCRDYGNRRGVIDVNLAINRGEIFGFLGPNGAGKSTTIRLLLGFLRASSGTAKILNKDCWSQSHQVKRDVGYVPGDVRLYPWMTANRAFKIVSRIHGRDLRDAGQQLAERFKLEVNLPVRKMSRGNRQKVSLVLAMIHEPQLLVLDEPTSGLDPLMQDELASCLREYASSGRTVFFSSHTLSEVEFLCDQIAIVRDGRIVANEPLSAMKARAPRVVQMTYENENDVRSVEWPEFLTLVQRFKTRCEFNMHGTAGDLIRWAASQPLADLEIGSPNLDALFRSFYSTDAD